MHHHKVKAREFVDTELRILDVLKWKLHVPTPHGFVDQLLLAVFAHGDPPKPSFRSMAMRHCDLSLYSHKLLGYDALTLGGAAILLALAKDTRHGHDPSSLFATCIDARERSRRVGKDVAQTLPMHDVETCVRDLRRVTELPHEQFVLHGAGLQGGGGDGLAARGPAPGP